MHRRTNISKSPKWFYFGNFWEYLYLENNSSHYGSRHSGEPDFFNDQEIHLPEEVVAGISFALEIIPKKHRYRFFQSEDRCVVKFTS